MYRFVLFLLCIFCGFLSNGQVVYPDTTNAQLFFYDDKYALIEQEGQFYFIGPSGSEVKKLGRWDQLEQFDDKGLAKASKGGYHYLIDTMGNRYRAAFGLDELDKDVQALDLRDRKWEGFPQKALEFPQLELLLLDGIYPNERELALPPEIGNLKKLKVLTAVYTKIEEIPKELGQLTSLEKLDLSWTNTKALPKELGQLSKLKSLHVINTPITQLPAELWSLKNLQVLDLSDTQLQAIPSALGAMRNLKKLNLSHTMIKKLPKEIGQLKSLLWLDISTSRIKKLPREIGQLQHLEWLELSSTKISKFPIEFWQLTDLKELYLGWHAPQLPAEIQNFQKLEWLFLNYGKFKSLPDEFKKLGKLKGVVLNVGEISLEEQDQIKESLPVNCKVIY